MQSSMKRALNPQPQLRPQGSRRPVAVQCAFISSRSLNIGKCPYRTLGISNDADEEEIKVAFRRKAKQMHPDVSSDPLAHLAFMECQHAYQTLLDPEKRAKYDKTLQPRANSQVLSYLNARSMQRHGVSVQRTVPSRGPYIERPELYGALLDLLQQVKVAARHLEREVVGKDGRRGFGTAAAAPTPAAVPPCTGGRVHVPDATECGEHECCEPWLYYAVQAAQEEQPARRRG